MDYIWIFVILCHVSLPRCSNDVHLRLSIHICPLQGLPPPPLLPFYHASTFQKTEIQDTSLVNTHHLHSAFLSLGFYLLLPFQYKTSTCLVGGKF